MTGPNERQTLPEYREDACPKCGGPVETGFGLAGGGYGVYSFCPKCEEIVSKSATEPNERQTTPKPVEKLEPHAYWPSAMHMGDCMICGHLQEAPIHSPFRRKEGAAKVKRLCDEW